MKFKRALLTILTLAAFSLAVPQGDWVQDPAASGNPSDLSELTKPSIAATFHGRQITLSSISLVGESVEYDGMFVDNGNTITARFNKVQHYLTNGRNWSERSETQVRVAYKVNSYYVYLSLDNGQSWVPMISQAELRRRGSTPSATVPQRHVTPPCYVPPCAE
jgi:hypothetical protein